MGFKAGKDFGKDSRGSDKKQDPRNDKSSKNIKDAKPVRGKWDGK